MERSDIGSWLGGPRAAADAAGVDLGYRGEQLGRPPVGVGSVAGLGRRMAALFVDWIGALLVAQLLVRAFGLDEMAKQWLVLALFALQVWLLTSLMGASFGQRLLGIGVSRLDSSALDPARTGLRVLLLCLVLPAVVFDRDGRGLHDRAVGSVVTLTRSR